MTTRTNDPFTFTPAPGIKPLFQVGRLFISSAVRRVIHPNEALLALNRHVTGDWGFIPLSSFEKYARILRLNKGTLGSCYFSQKAGLYVIHTTLWRQKASPATGMRLMNEHELYE